MSGRDWTRAALLGVLVLLIVLASGGVGFAAGWNLSPLVASASPTPTPGPSGDIQQRFRVFWEAWDLLDREFDRSGPLDTQKMIYGAISGMVHTLGDPHTVWIEPVQAKIIDQDMEGSFEGIGATVAMADGYLTIEQPLPNSPALKAGLKAGDVLLAADGKSLQGLDLGDALLLIRGPKGTPVRLTIRRPGEGEPLEIIVTRDKIDAPTVTYRMLDDGIGYVRLADFNLQATTRLQAALRALMEKKPRALIFDLRGNSGGYLHIAVQIASQFIKEGIIVTEKDNKDSITEYKAEGKGLALSIPLVVLVDGGSASAAEIVAGAIQDSGRGVLLGRQTYGKGSVQAPHTLSDGSSLRVTIARWYTPKGSQIDGKGLTPDIVVPADPSKPVGEDPVLDRAVQYLKAPRT